MHPVGFLQPPKVKKTIISPEAVEVLTDHIMKLNSYEETHFFNDAGNMDIYKIRAQNRIKIDRSTGDKWLDSLLENHHNAKFKYLESLLTEAVLQKQKKEEENFRKFMKLGPEMPEKLARAMASGIILQNQAAIIFREGWHRKPFTDKLIDALIDRELIFETALWLKKHSKHEVMTQAIFDNCFEIKEAEYLFSIGFEELPDATAAIVEGNDLDLVASMYNVQLPKSANFPLPTPEVYDDGQIFTKQEIVDAKKDTEKDPLNIFTKDEDNNIQIEPALKEKDTWESRFDDI